MGDLRTKSQSWAIKEEVTPGTYVAPAAGTDYVQTTQDGSELTKSKESIERNIFTGSIGSVAPRTGQTQAGGSMKVEFRAGETEGAEPEHGILWKSFLGAKRALTSDVTVSGSTASVLKVADASQYSVGDIVLIDDSHLTAIIGVDQVDDELTLLVPLSGVPANGTKISASTVYTVGETGHTTLSVTRYYEAKIRQYITGARPNSFSLEGFEVGQTPTISFGLQALDFQSDVHTQAHTPSYDDVLPPIILDAVAVMDGSTVHVNGVSLSGENTISNKTSVVAANGIVSNSVSARSFSGSFAPYMKDDSVANYTKFKNNTPFSLFIAASLPGTSAGERQRCVAIYLPNCVATSIQDADQEGLMVETIEFSANMGDGSQNEIFVAFI